MNLYVCVGSACHLKGAYNIIGELQQIIDEKNMGHRVVIKAALCLGRCSTAVSVRVNEEGEIFSLSMDTVRSFFEDVIMKNLD